jgi:hypothetical protein
VPKQALALEVVCTNCGAKLPVDGTIRTLVCEFCGTHNVMSRELWEQFHPPEAMPMPAAGGRVLLFILAPAVVVVVVIALVMGLRPKSHSVTPPLPTFTSAGSSCGGAEWACSADGKSMLECVSDKLVVADTCKGPKGCRSIENGKKVSCDHTRADVGDPCYGSDSSCSTDGKMEVRCDGAKYIAIHACGGPDGCTVTPAKNGGYDLSCDDHMAPPDAPCDEDGRMACSTDSKSLLRCARGHFTVASACKHGCTLTKNHLDDTTTIDCER